MSDKFFSSVQLLCGFNGTDGATSFTDESAAARTATFVGNAQLDTAQSKWGSASLLLDGSGDVVTFPDAASLELGNGDFTIQQWVRFATTPAAETQDIITKFNATGNQRSWGMGYSAGNLRFFYSPNGATPTTILSDAWAPAANTWYYVAARRIGTSLETAVNGSILGTHNVSTTTFFNSTAVLAIGAESGTTNPFNGHIDEVRLTVGLGRADAFVVPQGPFSRQKNLGTLTKGRQPVVLLAA